MGAKAFLSAFATIAVGSLVSGEPSVAVQLDKTAQELLATVQVSAGSFDSAVAMRAQGVRLSLEHLIQSRDYATIDGPTINAISGQLKSAARRKSSGKLQFTHNGVVRKSPKIDFFWVIVNVLHVAPGRVDYKPFNEQTLKLASLHMELTRVEQTVSVDPPGAVDLSAYLIHEYILEAYTYIDKKLPNGEWGEEKIPGTPVNGGLDGRAPANGVLFDRHDAEHGPDLDQDPLQKAFKYAYSQQKTVLVGSPFHIPHKLWGWGFWRTLEPQRAYGIQVFLPFEHEN